jgi:hypothetical protein
VSTAGHAYTVHAGQKTYDLFKGDKVALLGQACHSVSDINAVNADRGRSDDNIADRYFNTLEVHGCIFANDMTHDGPVEGNKVITVASFERSYDHEIEETRDYVCGSDDKGVTWCADVELVEPTR